MEAQIDKKILTMFNNVCRQTENAVEKQIAYQIDRPR